MTRRPVIQIDTGADRYAIHSSGVDKRGKPEPGSPVHLWRIHFPGPGVTSAGPSCGHGSFHIFASLDRRKVTCRACLERIST